MTIYDLLEQAAPGIHDRGSGWAKATLERHCVNNFPRALRLAIAEHDWRRGYAGPCPPEAKCPTCKEIAELEGVKT